MKPAPPPWLMNEIRRARKGAGEASIQQMQNLLTALDLPTVCESARCPNRGECFSCGTATFLILGDVCTRRCGFCAVQHGLPAGPPDPEEPQRLARAVAMLHLSHVVITSVTRDDLADGGAAHFAQVVKTLRHHGPNVTIELLVPDFQGDESALRTVLETRPDILAHNLETVPRLYEKVRRGAHYNRSLRLLHRCKQLAPDILVKSGLMLGLGETSGEIQSVLDDLAGSGCDLLTLGQYLAPSLAHVPAERYVCTAEFDYWRDEALNLGFKHVTAGSLVRSSYKASESLGKI